MPFKMRCPKCSSRDIEFPKLQHGYRESEPSLHCRTCGKMLYGKEVIEAEYHRQEALAVTVEPVRPIAPVIKEVPGFRDLLERQLQQWQTEAEACATTALGHKTRLTELRQTLQGMPGDSPPALDLNRWGIDAGRIGWLVEELQREASYLDGSPSTGALQAMSKRIREALGRIQKEFTGLLERLPQVEASLLAERERLAAVAQQAVAVEPPPPVESAVKVQSTRCAWQDCPNGTTDGRLYCCTEHRHKQARWNYRQRQLLARPLSQPETKPPAPPPTQAPPPTAPQVRPQPGENQPRGIPQACALCGVTVWKKPYQVKRNISGLFFCGHEHHQSWVVSHGGVGAEQQADLQ